MDVEPSNGVRQGSLTRVETRPFLPPPPPPHHGGSFMDDTYLWGENPAHLQRCLDILETLLRQHDNTQTFTVGGKTIVPDTGDTPVRVLGSPASFRGTTPQLAAEMRSRARTAYAQNKQVLTAPTPAKPRVQLHDTLVRQAALWGCETWPPQDTLLRAANTQQLTQIRNMTGGTRKPEQWADWNKRSMRQARPPSLHEGGEVVHLHATPHLEALGTRSQGRRTHQRHSTLERPGILEGGAAQASHAGCARFCSQLDTERQIAAVAGKQWATVAGDRRAWTALEQAFVDRYDPPWATGKQPQLTNLAPARAPPATARLTDRQAPQAPHPLSNRE